MDEMIVTRDDLYQALDRAIDNYTEVDTQINHDELSNIIHEFKHTVSHFDAEDRIDEIAEESDDDTKDDVDD